MSSHYKLDRLAKSSVFMANLRFDVTPEIIFRPRFASESKNHEALCKETQGFMFYVDYMPPTRSSDKEVLGLMIMKTYNLTSKTIGDVPDAPRELLEKVIKAPGAKSYTGMYVLSPELEAWIKKGLGIV